MNTDSFFARRASTLLGLAVVYFVFLGLFDARLWRSGYVFDGSGNPQILEAKQWWSGRLDLPERLHDTALHDGRIYSHFPPMFTILAALVVPMFGGVPHWFVVTLLLLPLPALAYVLMGRVLSFAERPPGEICGPSNAVAPPPGWQRMVFFFLIALPVVAPVITGFADLARVEWSGVGVLAAIAAGLLAVLGKLRSNLPLREVLLTLGLLCGTSLWPVADRAVRAASPYHVNHVLAVAGIMILLIELLGRRRVCVGGLGLLIASLSRQMTLAFALPLAWMAFQAAAGAARRRALMQLTATLLLALVVPMILNQWKFGNPLENGYGLIYEGRDDYFARDAREHGVFSPAFIGRNSYYMNFGLWERYVITVAGKRETHFRPNDAGTGIWWTTPLLIWLFLDLPRILRTSPQRWLLVTSALIYGALLTFHATGATQRGFNRFSLDYLPALIVLVAPSALVGWRTWISAAMIGWSVIYFVWMIG